MILVKDLKPAQKLAVSGVVVALYVALMYLTQGFAFLQYQIRIATALYSLGALFPFLVVPLGFANLLSNIIMGGLGPLDAFGGFAAGILTTGAAWLIGKSKFKWSDILIALPIIFIPGLLVPIWLSYLLELPYAVLAVNLCLGQVVPGIAGVLLVKALKGIKLFN